MQRMRCAFANAALLTTLTLGFSATVSAELIQPPGGRPYPDLAGADTGKQNYTYDPVSRTGFFQATNTPFLLSTGPGGAQEAIVQPDADGVRSQVVNLTLDQQGRLINNGNNSYALYGTVVIGGQRFQGLLLQGTPKTFGAQSGSSTVFNLDLKITGGALASSFGPEAYMELRTADESKFDGSFAKSFSTIIDATDTRSYSEALPESVPEPSTLIVLLACGAAWLLQIGRRGFPLDGLEPAE